MWSLCLPSGRSESPATKSADEPEPTALETAYVFRDVPTLVDDFWADV